MTYLDLKLKIMGYGLGFEIKKTIEDHSPKNKDLIGTSRSRKKFRFYKNTYDYQDWSFVGYAFYNYGFIFIIYLNRG